MANGDISIGVDGVIKAIKEVGFPIVAFLLMFWMVCTQSETVKNNTDAIYKVSEVMTALATQTAQFQGRVDIDHLDAKNDRQIILERTRP